MISIVDPNPMRAAAWTLCAVAVGCGLWVGRRSQRSERERNLLCRSPATSRHNPNAPPRQAFRPLKKQHHCQQRLIIIMIFRFRQHYYLCCK